MKDEIKETSINLIALNMQKTLVRDGFLLSSGNPFFNWIRGEQVTSCTPEELGLSFYIANPPVQPISPFDCCAVRIILEPPPLGSIYFELTFYFYTALQPCIEVGEIEEVYGKHDTIWFSELSSYFTEIKDSFNLSWDTEYDESIEDTLSGRIPLEEAENIPSIMKALKLQYEQWC